MNVVPAVQCDVCLAIAFVTLVERMIGDACSRPGCTGHWRRASEHDLPVIVDRRALRDGR